MLHDQNVLILLDYIKGQGFEFSLLNHPLLCFRVILVAP